MRKPNIASNVVKTVSLVSLILLFGCSDPEITITPVTLAESESRISYSHDELADFIAERNIPISSSQIKYDVEVFYVTYHTTYKGNDILASGLVILPKTNDKVGILSFQHGTISAYEEAPTESTGDALKFYSALATPGFVGVVPDFIGFGSSTEVLHPYYVKDATSNAVVDNIKAARELALINKLHLSNRLFLAGYSQGGYATMAAHKEIEEMGGKVEDLELIASFPASGGYDVKGMQEYFFNQDTYSQPFYLAYVALAYKQTYDWDEDLSIFFKEPFASKIPTLFNGANSGSDINSQLTYSISDYIQGDLLENIDSDAKYSFIVDAFNENSLTDWTPTIPLFMYHGNLDTTVPFQNSESTYNKLIANGASSEVVTLTPLPFANHSTGVAPYIVEFVNKLLLLK